MLSVFVFPLKSFWLLLTLAVVRFFKALPAVRGQTSYGSSKPVTQTWVIATWATDEPGLQIICVVPVRLQRWSARRRSGVVGCGLTLQQAVAGRLSQNRRAAAAAKIEQRSRNRAASPERTPAHTQGNTPVTERGPDYWRFHGNQFILLCRAGSDQMGNCVTAKPSWYPHKTPLTKALILAHRTQHTLRLLIDPSSK